MALTVFKPDQNAAQPLVQPETTGNAAPPSINQNTLNDFTKVSGLNETSFKSGTVKLYVYSPKSMPHQVLRSYTYQFTPDFVDAVTQTGYTNLSQAVGPGSRTPNVNKTILPDSEGRMVDLSNWDNLWTFTMIIDDQQTQYANITPPRIRLIASGYFMDEPGTVSMGSFLPNPNAILVFTHVTNIAIRQNCRSLGGAVDGLFVGPQTYDFAGESVPIFYNENMYLGTPSEILKESQEVAGTQGFSSYESMNLSNVKEGQGMRAIKSDLKAPRHQLTEIMSGLDSGIDQVAVTTPVYDTMSSNDDYIDPVNRAMSYAVNTMPNSVYTNFNRQLDVSKPISMGELMQSYPNLNIFPTLVRAGKNYGWDVAHQVGINTQGTMGPIITPKQVFSSLASSVVQSVCSALGIATVAFSYRWIDGDGFVTGKQEAFQICQFGLMVNRTNQQVLEQYTHRLKSYLDTQLFEVIHDNCGDFEINVLCDAAGTVLIDLNLYCFPDNQDGSYFQTDSKLGGILNPLVCNQNILNNNVNQLCNTAANICGKTFANDLYNNPNLSPV